MAVNNKKSGSIANVEILTDITVVPGDFHIIGKQLGVALGGGVQGDTIAVQLDGEWLLPCDGVAFEPGTPLNFSIPNLNLYAGAALVNDFENVAVATTAGGGAAETCQAVINQPFGIVVE